jgi:hypothetical protein
LKREVEDVEGDLVSFADFAASRLADGHVLKDERVVASAAHFALPNANAMAV